VSCFPVGTGCAPRVTPCLARKTGRGDCAASVLVEELPRCRAATGFSRPDKSRRRDLCRTRRRLLLERLGRIGRLLATLYLDELGDYLITNDQGAPGLDAGDTGHLAKWFPQSSKLHSPMEAMPLERWQPAFDAAEPCGRGHDYRRSRTFALTGSPSTQAGVSIDKSLTLQAWDYVDGSPNNTTTILQAMDASTKPIDLRISAPDVTIQGFTLDFNGATGSHGASSGDIGGMELNGNPDLTDIHILNNNIRLPDGDPRYLRRKLGPSRTGGPKRP